MSGSKSSAGNPVFFDGQKEAGNAIFAPGGIYEQFLQGKPNAGFERAQGNALQQLQRQQASAGTLNTPLGTRQQSDFLQKSTQAAGDNFMEQLFPFLQPYGNKTRGSESGLVSSLLTFGMG